MMRQEGDTVSTAKRTIKSQANFYDLLILSSVTVMFSPVFYRLVTYGWRSVDYTHAYFILPIFLWLLWRQKDFLVQRQHSSLSGCLLFVSGVALYVFSAISGFMFLEAISFVVVVASIFKIRFTEDSFKKMIFPISYLLFLVPPPQLLIDTVTLPLKKISAVGSFVLLTMAHLPAAIHGSILRVGKYELFVSDACSGFRSIVTLMALGSLYAYFQKIPSAKRWLIFISVLPLGIAGNVFRIFLTGIFSFFLGIEYAEGFFHQFSGGVLFLFTVFGLMFVTELVRGWAGVRAGVSS